MNLSITEPNNSVGIIKVRQYDSETQIFEATISENGKPVDLTDLTVLFCVRASPVTGLGLSEQIVEDVDAAAGIVRHTLTDYDMQMIGLNKAYFAFRKKEGDGYRYKHQFSTKDFPYTVMPSIFSDGIKDSNYIWTFEEILRYFYEWVQESMKTYDDWYIEAQKELERIITEFNSWIAANQDIYDEWIDKQQTNFDEWFESIKDILNENAAGNLLLLIQDLEKLMNDRLVELHESHFTLKCGDVGILRIIQDDNFSKTHSVEVLKTVNDIEESHALVIADIDSEKQNVFNFEKVGEV